MSDGKKEISVGGRPAIYETPESLEKAVQEYFEGGYLKIGSKWTITGLAYHLGFESRQSFYDYEEKKEFSYIIKRSRLLVEMGYETNLHSNNPTGSIFALK